MKRLALLLSILLASLTATSLEAAKKCAVGTPTPTGPKIRVLLEKDIKSALLEVKGPYAVVRKDNAEVLSTGNMGKRFVVHALHDGIRWGEEYPDVFSITVIPANSSTTMYVNGIQYKGAISVYHCRDNKVTIVNDVPIEDFLKSTLTFALDRPLSSEAMAAYVIAERTAVFADVKKGMSAKFPWDTTAKEENYLGYAVAYDKAWLEEAIDATRFMVLQEGDSPCPGAALSPAKAEELAGRGMDAKRILQSAFPRAQLSVTAAPRPVAVR